MSPLYFPGGPLSGRRGFFFEGRCDGAKGVLLTAAVAEIRTSDHWKDYKAQDEASGRQSSRMRSANPGGVGIA